MLLLLLCLLIPLQIGSSGPVEKADYFLFDATQALSPIHCTQTDLQAACFQGMFLLPTYLAHPWTEHFSNTLQEKKTQLIFFCSSLWVCFWVVLH